MIDLREASAEPLETSLNENVDGASSRSSPNIVAGECGGVRKGFEGSLPCLSATVFLLIELDRWGGLSSGSRFDGNKVIHAGGICCPCFDGPILFAFGSKGCVSDNRSEAPSNSPFGASIAGELLLGVHTCCSSFATDSGSSTQREHTGGSLAIIPLWCGSLFWSR